MIRRGYVKRSTAALPGTTAALTDAKHNPTLSAAKTGHTQGQKRVFSAERFRATVCVHSRAPKPARLRPQTYALQRPFSCSARVFPMGAQWHLPCNKPPHGKRHRAQGARDLLPCPSHRRHAQTPHDQLGGLCAFCTIETPQTREELGEKVYVKYQTSRRGLEIMSAPFTRESIQRRVYDAAHRLTLLRSKTRPSGTLCPS